MKKNIRNILSLLLVLVFVFQFSGSLAWADDAEVTGNEALVYELFLQKDASEKPAPVSAEQEAELLNNKPYSIELARDDADQPTRRAKTALSRNPGSAALNNLLKEDLSITPPEGFYVSALYLRGDELGSNSPKTLPFQAEKESTVLTMKAGAAAAKDGSFDEKLLSTRSTSDPKVYTLVVVLRPLVKDGSVTVTEALDPNAAGTETKVETGESYTASSPAGNETRNFINWKLRYSNGATLFLKGGDSFRPYADCRLDAQWQSIITITANTPVSGSSGYEPNGYSYSGSLSEGDAIESVQYTIMEDAGQITSVPRDAVIKNGDHDVTANYELRYVPSDPVSKEADDPDPAPDDPEPAPVTKVAITVTAQEPVLGSDGKTYTANGATYSGTLNPGDSIVDLGLDVKQNEAGDYFVVPHDAVIKNGDTDNTANYEITYANSKTVTPPAPTKVKLTITAQEPVLSSDGKSYVSNNATFSGVLNPGDSIVDLGLDVKQNEAGDYFVVPHDAVIKNGDTDNTANYEITYVNSKTVTPPAPTKVKLTITAQEPVLGSDGKTYVANNATFSGVLNEGDKVVDLGLDVKQDADGNYYVVPHDAVIKNGDTDNTANYEITYVNSKAVTPSADKIALTIRSKDRTAEYTGKPITADSYELVTGALAQGDSIEVQYAGGSTDVTTSPVASTISSLTIKDSEGKDVTATKYAVTIDNDHAGKVTVTKRSITVTAISGKVETDGNTVIYAKDCKTANGEFKNGYKAEGLLSGHELRGDFVKGSGKETFVTSIDVTALQIVDTANGNANVTANYNVKTVDGKMTIVSASQTGVPVAVTVSDQSWTYNGAANKPDQTKYNISGLLDGDVATVKLQIKQGETQVESVTDAGTYTIVPVVTIQTKDGKPVAENKYRITAANATLTVKKMDITLEAVSDSKAYDGKALVNDKVKASPLASGHKYQGVKLNVYDAKGNLIKNGAKEVGTYVKRITEVHVVDANGKEVTDNYNITKVDGKLTITNSSKNDSKNPKTGDTSVVLYVVLLIASLLLLGTIVAFLIVRSRKQREEQEPYPDEYYDPEGQQNSWQEPETVKPDFSAQLPENWADPQQDWNSDPRNRNDR